MAQTAIDRLHEKVQRACAELKSVKRENLQIRDEMKLIREENNRARKLSRLYTELLDERKKVQRKLESLLQKIDRLGV